MTNKELEATIMLKRQDVNVQRSILMNKHNTTNPKDLCDNPTYREYEGMAKAYTEVLNLLKDTN